ncbi:MAG: DUF433 domain-containing protein [Thermoguttaceae bacterium]|jgi:uncharacterized protein (DUF433 family)
MEPILTQHIESTPGTRGGKPRITGTRICVSDVVIWTERGRSPEEIVTDFPQLSLSDVFAALAYYYDHREEIDRQMKESEAFARTMEMDQGVRVQKSQSAKDQGTGGDSISSR